MSTPASPVAASPRPVQNPPAASAGASPGASSPPPGPGVSPAPALRYPAGAWPTRDAFESQKARAAYDKSLGGEDRATYDPKGFLASLGMPARLGSPGRRDVDMFRAFAATGFSPEPGYLPGPRWLAGAVQSITKFLARIWAPLGVGVARFFNLFAKDTQGDAKLPRFGEPIDGAKSPDAAAVHYAAALKRVTERESELAFEADFHEGSIARSGEPSFGTFDIAKGLGFTAEQARRLAATDFDVDTDETPYKDQDGHARKTHGAQGLDLHWHFNRAKAGEEDTRITAARLHLERAIARGKEGKFDAAERELGIGLHSLQDMFAHGQIMPMTHALLGTFPDVLRAIPVNAYEAQQATEKYLGRYLEALGLTARAALPVTVRAESIDGERAATLAGLPAAVRGRLVGTGLRFSLTDARVRPSDLGFGVDIDGDRRITGGESLRSDGRSWNDVPAGIDVARGTGFIARSAIADGSAGRLLRHELMHALIAKLAQQPASSRAIVDTWQAARDRGELGQTPASVQEYLAARLASLGDAALVTAVDALASGHAL